MQDLRTYSEWYEIHEFKLRKTHNTYIIVIKKNKSKVIKISYLRRYKKVAHYYDSK